MASFLTGADLSEWQECRKTIGRLDTTIADLRKFGFSLVTILITASNFLGQQKLPDEGKVSVAIALMALIAVLFAIDRYYTLLLNGAVERALDIEGPKLDLEDLQKDKLTQVISVYAINSGAAFIVPVLYLGFLWATRLLASAMAKQSSEQASVPFWICVAFIVLYFVYTEGKNKTGSFGERRRSDAAASRLNDVRK
jgi:hypothetical protein